MNLQKISIFLLRIMQGWVYFYAGITKVTNPDWSAAGYLNNAKTFPGIFHWFAQPGVLPVTNFLNEWGLTLLGASLILGIFVRFSAPLGIMLMAFYYLALPFPHPNPNAFLIDEHIIYSVGLLLLMVWNAEKYWGLEKMFISWFSSKE